MSIGLCDILKYFINIKTSLVTHKNGSFFFVNGVYPNEMNQERKEKSGTRAPLRSFFRKLLDEFFYFVNSQIGHFKGKNTIFPKRINIAIPRFNVFP